MGGGPGPWRRCEPFHRLAGDGHLPLGYKQELGLVPALRLGLWPEGLVWNRCEGSSWLGLARPLWFRQMSGLHATLNLGLIPQVLLFLDFRIIYLV